jgi:SAM-dependent methyltransferase
VSEIGETSDPSRWTPASVDVERPSAARIYDYLLGGAHNFASDREVAEQALAVRPDLRTQAFANRDFLGRAVEYVAGAGIRQFLDIGSGIPTVGNVHEIARRANPDARVVYVDQDPVAVAHAQAILDGDPHTEVIQEDLRGPERILRHPTTLALLDLDEPVAVLLVAILHVIPDSDDPYGIVAALHRAVAPGSYLIVAHGTADEADDEATRLQAVSRNTNTPMTLRSRSGVARFFDGWDLVEPGMVWAHQWRPRPDAEQTEHQHRAGNLVGVARKPS